MTTNHETQMKEIQSWDEAPTFQDEDAEVAYWETHAFGDALLADALQSGGDPRLPPARGRNHHRARMISLRLDAELLVRLKELARQRNTGYQTLLKQWVTERLAVEESLTTHSGDGGDDPAGDAGVRYLHRLVEGADATRRIVT